MPAAASSTSTIGTSHSVALKPPRAGVGEHVLAVLVDERRLDLLLVLAGRDLVADELRAPAGRRASSRRSAPSRTRRTSPRPRCPAARPPAARRASASSAAISARELHACSASSFGRCWSSHSCVTGKRRIAAIRPAAVDQERLRVAGRRRTRARRSGRGRAGSGTSRSRSLRNASALLDASCVSTPSTSPPWGSICSCVFCSSGTSSTARVAPRGPHVQHDDLALVVGERALPVACAATAAPRAAPPAAGPWPPPRRASCPRPWRRAPYASSPTSAAATRVTGQKTRIRTSARVSARRVTLPIPAGVVQWLRRWLPKPKMGVRFPSPALIAGTPSSIRRHRVTRVTEYQIIVAPRHRRRGSSCRGCPGVAVRGRCTAGSCCLACTVVAGSSTRRRHGLSPAAARRLDATLGRGLPPGGAFGRPPPFRCGSSSLGRATGTRSAHAESPHVPGFAGSA